MIQPNFHKGCGFIFFTYIQDRGSRLLEGYRDCILVSLKELYWESRSIENRVVYEILAC